MEFWGKHLNWGYGYFNCNGGEHLNKRIKCMEFGSTNLQSDRFSCIVRSMRVKQIHHPEQILHKITEKTCSACMEVGHNKKNKNCPMHPSRLTIDFSESEEES